jgi:carbamoyl-phosphate synthase large subunit
VFFSLAERDKAAGVVAAGRFVELGFSLVATAGTAAYLEDHGVPVEAVVAKVGDEGGGLSPVELIATGKVQLVVNTPRGRGPRADGAYIRTAASVHKIPCLTTVAAARAAAAGIADWERHGLTVRSLQEFLEGDQLRLPL